MPADTRSPTSTRSPLRLRRRSRRLELGASAPQVLVVALVLLLLGATAFLVWRQVSSLQTAVENLSAEVQGLGRDLAKAEDRAQLAEQRATQAEERADVAEADAEAAHQKATDAQSEAVTAQESAEEARVQAQRETAAREAALAAKEEAEELTAEAQDDADRAREEARIAQLEAKSLRQQRERELARLQQALSKIADTRRTAMGLVMSLGGDRIEFDFDRAELRPENREILSRIAGVLLTAGDTRIQIFGHTDDVGTEEYNLKLSEQRANAVRDYLVAAGIDPDIVTTRGFGKSRPLVEGTDAQSRQRNRRVEIGIIQTDLDFEPVE